MISPPLLAAYALTAAAVTWCLLWYRGTFTEPHGTHSRAYARQTAAAVRDDGADADEYLGPLRHGGGRTARQLARDLDAKGLLLRRRTSPQALRWYVALDKQPPPRLSWPRRLARRLPLRVRRAWVRAYDRLFTPPGRRNLKRGRS